MENEIIIAGDVIKIIDESKQSALRKVNEELVQMYWKIGEYLSRASENVNFGDAFIDTISKEIQTAFPGIKGKSFFGFLCHRISGFAPEL